MTLPNYADLTRADPNPVKRWLQERRLCDALALLPATIDPRLIVDFGAGDGELATRLADRFPQSRVIAFEPAPEFAAAARARLGDRVEVVEAENALPTGGADLVTCTEVFEHLPDEEAGTAVAHIARVLKPGGLLLLGLPVETGPPALVKGLFRMVRRPGAVDARWADVWRATLGRPSAERPIVEICPGRRFIPSHLGFDQRAACARLASAFELDEHRGSPIGWAPPWAASEMHWLGRRRADPDSANESVRSVRSGSHRGAGKRESGESDESDAVMIPPLAAGARRVSDLHGAS